MDNSDDDYFNDDLILDDNALAALDEAESRYAATQKRPASFTGIAPVAKRQKAFHEITPSQPLPALQRNISLNDFEDLPDIFVQGDGSYEITPAVRTFGVPTPAPRTQPRTGGFQAPLSRTPPGNKPVSYPVRPPPIPAPPVAGPSNHRQQPQPSSRVSGPVSGTQQKVHVNYQTNPPPTRRVTQPHHEFGSQSSRPSQSGGSSNTTLKNTISILQAQVEDLKKEQAKMTEALKAAEQARLAKQGEVTILRANIEKTAESHVSEVLRLQAAKEVSEAMRVHLQKEQKEEIERLKTQYKFKQLEMETAARKPPWSVQGKRISRDINMTPMKAPSQMREWNSRGGPHNGVQTPRRPQFGVIDSPVTQRSRRQPPTPAERTPPLPGFYNSFASTPSKAPLLRVKSKGKGKEREIDNNVFFVSGNVNSSPPSSPIRARRDEAEVQDFIMGDAAPLRTNKPVDHPQLSVAVDNDDDVKMGFEFEENSPVPNDYSEIEAPDWRNELHRLIFTHSLPSFKSPTLHLLFNNPLGLSASQEQLQAYSGACARLLESTGASSEFIHWDVHLRSISSILSEMASMLVATGSISSLSSIFNLLRRSCYSIPSFPTALLTPLPNTEDVPPRILTALRDAIPNRLDPKRERECNEDSSLLAYETVALLEAFSWNVPEDLIPQLSVVIRGHNVLMTLLSPSQPTQLVCNTVRALSLLATHRCLFKVLLSHSNPSDGTEPTTSRDVSCIPHIEQLSFYLADSRRDGPEDQLRETILSFIAALALSHPDALSILLQSSTLLPSIIHYLTDVTTPFWEDDDDLLSSPSSIDRVIRAINRTVALLYYMVFTPDPTAPYDLSRKLRSVRHRHFNGIQHMFTVTMGRLTFADSPAWLTETQRIQFETTIDTANKLLELVVDGPEIEMVWNAFQVDSDSKATKADVREEMDDDEEREARLLHPNVDMEG